MGNVRVDIPKDALTQWASIIAAKLKGGVDAAMLEAVELAYKDAVLTAKQNFNNTPGRVRTGQLMNAIHRGYDPSTKVGYVGAKLAYARIQELGGTVHPVSAKHLWVKNYVGVDSQFKRLTPREFMDKKNTDPKHFALFRNPKTKRLIAAYNARGGGKAQTVALFALVDSVTLPERPYLRPAVAKAAAAFGEILKRRVQ